MVQSGFPVGAPAVITPLPVLRSINHWPAVLPSLVMFQRYVAFIFCASEGVDARRAARSLKMA